MPCVVTARPHLCPMLGERIQKNVRERLPRHRALRIIIGVALVFGGLAGFLPILGFWMIPLGLLVLSYDIPAVRRWRRRFVVWWERRRNGRRKNGNH